MFKHAINYVNTYLTADYSTKLYSVYYELFVFIEFI